MSFYRRSCRLVRGYSSKLRAEVCQGLGVLGPQDIIRVEQTRLLACVALHGPGFLWEASTAGKRWATEVFESLRRILGTLQVEWDIPEDLSRGMQLVARRAAQV